MMIVQLVSLALVVSVAAGERYTFDFTKHNVMRKPSVVKKGDTSTTITTTRMLQSDGNTEPCYYDSNKLVCQYSFAAGAVGNETAITFMARCDINPLYGFDYRRTSNCACLALVTPAFGTKKECPCTVCAADLGETPVSVDCSVHETPATIATTSRAENITEDDDDLNGSASVDDSVSIPEANATTINASEEVNITTTDTNNIISPFIFSECSSIDCFGACNGTCSLDCDDPSGNVCPYCETYTGSGATTSAPTGSGNNEIGGLGEPPQSAPSDTTSNGVTVGLSTAAVLAIGCAFLM